MIFELIFGSLDDYLIGIRLRVVRIDYGFMMMIVMLIGNLFTVVDVIKIVPRLNGLRRLILIGFNK